jgi:hypothetical protein
MRTKAIEKVMKGVAGTEEDTDDDAGAISFGGSLLAEYQEDCEGGGRGERERYAD